MGYDRRLVKKKQISDCRKLHEAALASMFLISITIHKLDFLCLVCMLNLMAKGRVGDLGAELVFVGLQNKKKTFESCQSACWKMHIHFAAPEIYGCVLLFSSIAVPNFAVFVR